MTTTPRKLATGLVLVAGLGLAVGPAAVAGAGDPTTSETQVQVRFHPRTGLVEGGTNADVEQCTDTNRPVRIERARTGRIVARTMTDRDSSFHFHDVDLRPGRYRVAAREYPISTEDGPVTCLRGASRVFGVR